ncbi:histone deacetylase 6 [Pelomyxa schiedti]|nr:histone deacetylase 6 [Pelomyxa schiedti]
MLRAGSFAVTPKLNCPHVTTAYRQDQRPATLCFTDPCASCGDRSENWVCATCFSHNCSRYVAGHAADHYDRTNHPVAVSLSDASFWCYECESYIEHPSLVSMRQWVQEFNVVSN